MSAYLTRNVVSPKPFHGLGMAGNDEGARHRDDRSRRRTGPQVAPAVMNPDIPPGDCAAQSLLPKAMRRSTEESNLR
jgi:hypothetical protein